MVGGRPDHKVRPRRCSRQHLQLGASWQPVRTARWLQPSHLLVTAAWETVRTSSQSPGSLQDHGNTCLVLLYATKFWVGCYAAIDNWYRSLLPALVTWTKRELWTTGLHEFHPNIYFCILFTYCLGEQEETLALEGPSRKIASRHL